MGQWVFFVLFSNFGALRRCSQVHAHMVHRGKKFRAPCRHAGYGLERPWCGSWPAMEGSVEVVQSLGFQVTAESRPFSSSTVKPSCYRSRTFR